MCRGCSKARHRSGRSSSASGIARRSSRRRRLPRSALRPNPAGRASLSFSLGADGRGAPHKRCAAFASLHSAAWRGNGMDGARGSRKSSCCTSFHSVAAASYVTCHNEQHRPCNMHVTINPLFAQVGRPVCLLVFDFRFFFNFSVPRFPAVCLRQWPVSRSSVFCSLVRGARSRPRLRAPPRLLFFCR